MSRIGKKPIEIPAGVDVTIEGNFVKVRGPKGELSRTLPQPITVRREDGMLLVERPSDAREHRSLHGLSRTLVSNMVEGVSKGFSRTLELTGVGYRATKQGEKVVIAIGFSHPVEVIPEAGISLEVPAPTRVVVSGFDKEAVGNLAARIRTIRPPEPYKGKGIKYEGERIRRKVGKAGTGKKK